MNDFLTQSLYDQLISLENRGVSGYRGAGEGLTRHSLVADAGRVIELLKARPYLPARAVARQQGLDKNRLCLVYKMIQGAKESQHAFAASGNRDYFNVVRHYFNRKFFTIVFFVGLSCPSRCIFCPNVKVDSQGNRELVRYESTADNLLAKEDYDAIIMDLEQMKAGGTDILIKVSGGLEPLTDPDTLASIANLARRSKIPVKLFTNGILLSQEKNRAAALMANDIRISLNTADDVKYETMAFGLGRGKRTHGVLARLKASIKQLVRERDQKNPTGKIGFNCIVMADNCDQVGPLVAMAETLGVDYVDFKPDYFTLSDASVEHCISDWCVNGAKETKETDLYINVVDSISRENFFWREWDWRFDAGKQLDYKVFVNPFGDCSPIHYGAFPHSEPNGTSGASSYGIGRIHRGSGLLSLLGSPKQIPDVRMKRLNPFELMLALEIRREEEDKMWGIPLSCSPYHPSLADEIPDSLLGGLDTL